MEEIPKDKAFSLLEGPTETLCRPDFKFCKVLKGDKKAFEPQWTKRGYSYDAPELQKWIAEGGNYGVMCGFGDLLVIDVDQYARLEEIGIVAALPPTYRVRSRSGGYHYYYFCKGFPKKVIFHDVVLNETVILDGKEKLQALHLGEMQWLGQMVVGPGSRFENREDPNPANAYYQYWKEKDALPIATITPGDITKIFLGKTKDTKTANVKDPSKLIIEEAGEEPDTGGKESKITVSEAVIALKSVCDNAKTVDGTGFNKNDVSRLGDIIDKAVTGEELEYKEESMLYTMLRKYHKQLADMGITLSMIVKPVKGEKEKHQAIDHSWQDKIPIAEIAMPAKLPDGSLKDNRETSGEIAGDNPFHGSSQHKGNFSINIKKNVWRCFHCDSGGGPLQLLAVSMGLLDCSEAKPGCLTGDKYKAVLAELRKRGYKVPNLTGTTSDKRKDLIFLMEEEFLANNQVATNQMGDLFVWNNGYKSMPDFVAMNMLQGYGMAYTPHVDPDGIATSLQSLKIKTVDWRPVDPFVLYCSNGVLYLDNLRGGKLRFEPYDEGELPPLSAIAAAYDPAAKCDFFIEHLQQSTETPEKDIEVIQEFFGYCLFKEQRYAKSMVFVGPGRDGKTVVVNTLINLIGSSLVCSVKPQDMTARFNFSDMYLKMLNSVGELPHARITDSTGFKAATGNDFVKIEAKYGRPFTAKLNLKSLFMANKVMSSDDVSDAYYDRFIFIVFPNQFGIGGDSPKRDSLRESKLTTPAMLSGILNWSLAGLERLIKNDEFSHQGDLEDRIRLHDSFTAPTGILEEAASRLLVERPSSRINLNEFKVVLEELSFMRGESMPSSQNGYTRMFKDMNIKLTRLKGLKSEGNRDGYDYWIMGREFSPQRDAIFKQLVGKNREEVRSMMFKEECGFDICLADSALWLPDGGQMPIAVLN